MPNPPMMIQTSTLPDATSSTVLAGLLEEARLANPSDPSRVDQCIRDAMTLLRVPDRTQASRASAGSITAVAKPSGLATWQTRRVETHIAANLARRLLVGELAATARLSTSYFVRAFKATFGETPCAYLMGQRVSKAKEMMLKRGNPLAEVALACGFSDQAHFCRLFRRFEGQSPAAWRRKHATSEWSVNTRSAMTQKASLPLPS